MHNYIIRRMIFYLSHGSNISFFSHLNADISLFGIVFSAPLKHLINTVKTITLSIIELIYKKTCAECEKNIILFKFAINDIFAIDSVQNRC